MSHRNVRACDLTDFYTQQAKYSHDFPSAKLAIRPNMNRAFRTDHALEF